MAEGLAALIAEWKDARDVFFRTRFLRDAAAVYYDLVADETPALTLPAWNDYRTRQAEMDLAGDHLDEASSLLIDRLLEQAPG